MNMSNTESLLADILAELRVANFLAAEAQVNLRVHPSDRHDDLVRSKINHARFVTLDRR